MRIHLFLGLLLVAFSGMIFSQTPEPPQPKGPTPQAVSPSAERAAKDAQRRAIDVKEREDRRKAAEAQCVIKPVMTAEDMEKCKPADR